MVVALRPAPYYMLAPRLLSRRPVSAGSEPGLGENAGGKRVENPSGENEGRKERLQVLEGLLFCVCVFGGLVWVGYH